MGLTQVSKDGVKNDAIDASKLPANSVGASELADNAVDTNAIADQAVALSKLPHGDGSSNGKFLRANNGADPSFESIPAGTTINNNADNRVITGDANSNTLNGESNVQINSSGIMTIGNDPSGAATLGGDLNVANTNGGNVVIGDTGSGEYLRLHASGTGAFVGSKSNHPLMFFTNDIANEHMRIVTNGEVGINITNPETYGISGTGYGGLTVQAPSGGYSGITIRSSYAGGGALFFADGNGSNAERKNLGFAADHVNKRMNFIVEGSTVCRFTEHGFHPNPADTAAANALDDYEEGSWSANNLNYDYDGNQAQRGHYIKIGRIVHAFFRVKFHNQSTYTGQHLRFTGLPFTSADGNPYDVNVGAVAHGYGSVDLFRIYVQPNTTYAYWYTPTGNNYNNSTNLNGQDMRGCITYTASS